MSQPVINPRPIRQDPDIQGLLARLPAQTALSLTDTQLKHLKVAIGTGKWRRHAVDLRGTFPVPFYPSRVYFVFLMGRNLRELSRQERDIAFLTGLSLILAFLVISTLIGILVLYVLKSALGINVFSDFSLGFWDWLQSSA